jgi:hypothetical protein
MSSKRYFKLSILMFFLAAFLAEASVTFAQKPGTAARGGSLGINTSDRLGGGSGLKNQPMYYRPIVRALELDFPEIDYPELEQIYMDAKNQNAGLKFETVIKAFIAAKQRSPQSGEDALRVDCIRIVDYLSRSSNSLSKALQRAFPTLTNEQGKEAERQANTRYKQAEREAALRQR